MITEAPVVVRRPPGIDERWSRVSVVIPAYNAEPWVASAIDSAKDQTPEPVEIIVVDDGSTDGTAVCAESHGARVIRQSNRGPSAARNAGAAVASGDALLFLDADDTLLPQAMARLLAGAARSPDSAAVVPNYLRDGAESGPAWSVHPDVEVFDRRRVRAMLVANGLAPNALVQREAWMRQGFREDLRTAEDFDLWLRFLLSGASVVRLGEPLVRKREGRPGAASVRIRSMRAGRRTVFATVWRRNDLTVGERAIVAYQLTRTTVGLWLGPGDPSPSRATPGVVQVYLDERGGGPKHVALLRRSVEPRIPTREVALAPSATRRPRGWIEGARATARAIDADRPLVHAHGIRAAAVALPAVMIRRVPLVITIHGLQSLRRSNTTAVRFLNRRVMRRASAVMVLSDSDRRAIRSARLVPDDRVRKIRAGFEPQQVPEREVARDSLGVPRDAVVVLWLGRMTAEKDPMSFVDAFARVDDPRAMALIAGDGGSSPDVTDEVASRGLGSRVRLLGWLDDPSDAIGAGDIFVSTSRWEGLPIAALESAAAGLALVLTDVPGSRDLRAAGVPAVLVPPGDLDRLAAVIDELAADDDRRRELGRGAAEVVRSTFTREALADDVLAVYEQLTRDGARRHAFGRGSLDKY